MLLVTEHVRVPDVVGEAGRVRQQVAQRDRAARRPKAGRPGGIKTVEHLDGGQLRQALADRLIQANRPLLDQLHHGNGSHRFGHGRDPDGRIETHVRVFANHARLPNAPA